MSFFLCGIDKRFRHCVKVPIERSATLLKWKMIGAVTIPSVVNVGDIEKTDGCKQAGIVKRKPVWNFLLLNPFLLIAG